MSHQDVYVSEIKFKRVEAAKQYIRFQGAIIDIVTETQVEGVVPYTGRRYIALIGA